MKYSCLTLDDVNMETQFPVASSHKHDALTQTHKSCVEIKCYCTQSSKFVHNKFLTYYTNTYYVSHCPLSEIHF
jgi:hypothetical protein